MSTTSSSIHKNENNSDNDNVVSRIQTRRSSRSNRSASPTMDDDSSSSSFNELSAVNLMASRITRSLSVESNGYDTTDSRKRKRKNVKSTSSSNANNNSQEVNRIQRKDVRDIKRAKRDSVIKERLDELDKLEKTIKDVTHDEYIKMLQDIELKRKKMLQIAEIRRSFAENNAINFFNAQKYAADSQFHWNKLALRRSMVQHVQHKINMLEQEYYSNHAQSSLDEEHISEWVPPDRPSMISSLTLGLAEEDVENDIDIAKQDPQPDNEQSVYNSTIVTATQQQPQYHQKYSIPTPTINSPSSPVDQKSNDHSTFTLPPLTSTWRQNSSLSAI